MNFQIGDIVLMKRDGGYGLVGEIGVVTGFGSYGHVRAMFGDKYASVFPLYLEKIA
jgi:hypothetical protein